MIAYLVAVIVSILLTPAPNAITEMIDYGRKGIDISPTIFLFSIAISVSLIALIIGWARPRIGGWGFILLAILGLSLSSLLPLWPLWIFSAVVALVIGVLFLFNKQD